MGKTRVKRKDKEKYKNVQPVFRLKIANRSSIVQVKHVGYFDTENDKLGDEIIELDEPLNPEPELLGKHTIYLGEVGEYEILARIFRCNIVGGHLVYSKRYPIIRVSVSYNRTISTGTLFHLYLAIDMPDDKKKELDDKSKAKNNSNHYLNTMFKGQLVQYIDDCDAEFKRDWEGYMKEKLEEEAIQNVSKIEDIETLTDDQVQERVNEQIEEEMNFYNSFMNEIPVERFESQIKVRDQFIDLIRSDRFRRLIEVAMRCRVTQRRNEAGMEEDDIEYKVPEKVTKMSDVRKQMEENDELADY